MAKNKASKQQQSTFVPKPKPLVSKKPTISKAPHLTQPLFGRVDKLTAGLIIATMGISYIAQVAHATSSDTGVTEGSDAPPPRNSNAKQPNRTQPTRSSPPPRANQKMCQRLVASQLEFNRNCPLQQNQNSAIANKPLLFSSHVRAAVHPGLYMLPNKLKSLGEWQVQQRLGALIAQKTVPGLEEPNAAYAFSVQLAKSLRKTFEIDQTYKEAGPGDRYWHDLALNWLESDILPVPMELMGENQWSDMLKKLNYRITAPDEKRPVVANDELQITEYRKGGSQINKVPFFPGIMKADSSLSYLQEHDPSNVPVFKDFVKYQNEYVASEAKKNIKKTSQHLLNFMDAKNPKIGAFLRKYYRWCPEADEIQPLMNQFFSTLKREIKTDPIKAAALAHMEFVYIHPFEDGNGRTARAFMNVILVQNGIPPVALLRNKQYMKIVSQAIENKDYKLFEDYLREEIAKAKKSAKETQKIPMALKTCLKEKSDATCQGLLTTLLDKAESLFVSPSKKTKTVPTKSQEKAARIAARKRAIRRQ
jgi:prophage maintenance system killer protein